jgi:hypothetical protein
MAAVAAQESQAKEIVVGAQLDLVAQAVVVAVLARQEVMVPHLLREQVSVVQQEMVC